MVWQASIILTILSISYNYHSANTVLWQQVGALRKRAKKSGEKRRSSSTFLRKLCSSGTKCLCVCALVAEVTTKMTLSNISSMKALRRFMEAEQSATKSSWFVSGPLKHLPVVVGDFPRIHLKPLQRFLHVEKQLGGFKLVIRIWQIQACKLEYVLVMLSRICYLCSRLAPK